VSVNPVDTKQRAPNPKVETTPRVLGYDAAGTVAAVGPEVTLFKPGDEVYYAGDVTRPGSNSELQLVDERIVGRKPKSLDFAQAAAIPLTAITAWEAYFDRMKIDAGGKHRGASLLIIGGAGGVGSIGIQIAKVVAGLNVIATASRPEPSRGSGARCRPRRRPRETAAPAARGARAEERRLHRELQRHRQYWDQMGDLVAPQGALCMIVGPKGPIAQDALRGKSASVCWELMFTRPRFKTPDMVEQHRLLTRVAELIDGKRIRGTMREALRPINSANMRAAHAKLESGTTIGTLVVAGWR
jgi:zinc-binding alcohol dehydrogenase family protein